MDHTLDFLREQQVDRELIQEVEAFRSRYPVEEEEKNRVSQPDMPFYGKEVLEMGIAAVLQGENILLTGAKATGKNILAENLAWIFGRPVYNVSFHVNTNSGDLIGTDTFADNRVQLRKGSIYRCAQYGGFGILDEINMAKNDAVSVLHAALDYRRCIDVPGYDRIDMHEAARFIATMTYGYAGTKELNEALVCRFLVIDMPAQDEEPLQLIPKRNFTKISENALKQGIGLCMDRQLEAYNREITTKALDLRGVIGALKTVEKGLKPALAVKMGVVNKCFDIFEKEIVQDVVMTRIPDSWTAGDVFEE